MQSVSNGRLKINIKQSSNVDNFKQQLLILKKGSYFKDEEVEKICEEISPKLFIHYLMLYHASRENEAKLKEVFSKIKSKLTISEARIKELFDFLISQRKLIELLKMQYTARPQDRPEIEVKIADDAYVPISEVSIGQKCTAMLIMALSQGGMPVIIDQPEDSLDIRSIWDDMCTKIRENKVTRQFIFTTHNSSLAVASDTDKFIIVQGNANKGEIVSSGAMDSKPIKDEVVDYLEGTRETYFKKYDKYNIEQ